MTAKRSLKKLKLNYRINNGKTRTVSGVRVAGGERYGHEMKRYYAEFRGQVTGARAGDRVKVWFTGEKRKGKDLPWPQQRSRQRRRERTVHVHGRPGHGREGARLADEDYTGFNPTYPAGTNAPRYAATHLAAIRAAGYSVDCGTPTRPACHTTSAC